MAATARDCRRQNAPERSLTRLGVAEPVRPHQRIRPTHHERLSPHRCPSRRFVIARSGPGGRGGAGACGAWRAHRHRRG
jgi:hypothetical protein